ncbi:pyruvate dehydrogenase (acetyl-transferring) E1 component subunit alpha [Pseudoxanthomonas kalamensis DSM 18571]|uniref:pyruvate dehydrogenase (acetyl-transferring) E1 component subunit alpha n=1 Tax=Pseudoxanthomonas kalamensis TaxID=289483 RepID=UPI0013909345|nr:pyruvate dehydrogenase (acetyl-transferring) E1 component subunit alpha [Pseudoxanthomonas kalamensis]KAF1708954.1 pyruvate dehydrogenase (acetyl-transferring) E1 component subunit alpha [Pseudoxanthomonas kalamensis DSM 18571]
MTLAASFEIQYLQYLDPDGRLLDDALPEAARDTRHLKDLFKRMLFVRAFDGKAVALQRTGKLGTYASSLGHEATHVGIGASMQADDVFAPSYREYGAQFMRGVRPRDVLLYWGGDERGNDYADCRQDYAWSVPIATQCLHAAGAALAFRLRGQAQIAVGVCGDGGSSKADFYAAINSAGAYRLPLVLCVINNGWAISLPRSAQTGAQTLAQKGIAGGLYCLQADGNDLLAVLEAMRIAGERARNGEGGSVIEFVTYRLSDHTTADDARRYRDDAEVKAAWQHEPLLRLRRWLQVQDLWSEEEERAWLQECDAQVAAEVDAYLATPPQPVEAMFDYLYADPPTDLLAQRAAAIASERGR